MFIGLLDLLGSNIRIPDLSQHATLKKTLSLILSAPNEKNKTELFKQQAFQFSVRLRNYVVMELIA